MIDCPQCLSYIKCPKCSEIEELNAEFIAATFVDNITLKEIYSLAIRQYRTDYAVASRHDNTELTNAMEQLLKQNIGDKIEIFESQISSKIKAYTEAYASSNNTTMIQLFDENSNKIVQTISTHIDSINSIDIDDESSVIKGAKGENFVYDMVGGKYSVEKYKEHAGDFILREKIHTDDFSDVSVMIEVKNYKSTVPTKEVKKFYGDLEDNNAIGAGLFLSLSSPIVKTTGSLEFRLVSVGDTMANPGRSVPCIFLHSNDENIVLQCIDLLFIHCKRKVDMPIIKKNLKSLSHVLDTINGIDNLVVEITETFSQKMSELRAKTLQFKYDVDLSMREIKDTVNRTGYRIESTKEKFFLSLEGKVELYPLKNEKNRQLFFNSIEPLLLDAFESHIMNKNSVQVSGVIQFRISATKTILRVEFPSEVLCTFDNSKYIQHLEITKGWVPLTYKFSVKKKNETRELLAFNDAIIRDIVEVVIIQ